LNHARFTAPTCVILGDPEIGEGTWIGHFTVLDGSQGLTIGKNCSIASGVHIYTHSTHAQTTRGEEKRVAPVVIEDNVAIGANAVVMYGSTIHKGAVVKALTLVKPYSEVWP
jgi:acetyltransferase-like isoleucine patch superfamily enzyme